MEPLNNTPRTIHTVESKAYAQYRNERYSPRPVFGWDEQGYALISLKGRLVRATETSDTLSEIYRDTVSENVGSAVSAAIKAICEDERAYLRHVAYEIAESTTRAKNRVQGTSPS